MLSLFGRKEKSQPETVEEVSEGPKIRTIEPRTSNPILARVNIIRMVLDQAQYEIDSINAEIAELDERKEVLLRKKQAHEEMLAVAKKYS